MSNQAPAFWQTVPASFSIEPRAYRTSTWSAHVPFAFWLIETLRPAQFVELGTWHGMSYLAFCQAMEAFETDTKAFAVDTWQGDPQAGSLSSDAFNSLRQAHDPHYARFSKLMRMTFDEAALQFTDGSIDLLHIDGLHTYEAVRNDFETWLPRLSQRAVVIFHDTQVRERDFGVYRLWAELTQRYAGFEFHHEHGLGVLGVGSNLPEGIRNLFAATSEPQAADRVRQLFDSLGKAVRTKQVLKETQQGWDDLKSNLGVRAVMKAQRVAGLAR